MKNIILVVLYKIKIMESPTIKSIMEDYRTAGFTSLAYSQLIVWDNSPNEAVDIAILKQSFKSIDVEYIHTPENVSLSIIYNNIAKKALASKAYLTIFDQDSILPAVFFKQLKKAHEKKYPLILPKIYCQGILVSPGKRFIAKGILLKSIKSGDINSKNLLAINSGMSIDFEVFQYFNYDERLRFYGTDTYFMRQYEKYYKSVYILDCVLEHSLAEMEESSIEWQDKHNQEKLEIFRVVFTETIVEKLFVWSYSFYLKLKKLKR